MADIHYTADGTFFDDKQWTTKCGMKVGWNYAIFFVANSDELDEIDCTACILVHFQQAAEND